MERNFTHSTRNHLDIINIHSRSSFYYISTSQSYFHPYSSAYTNCEVNNYEEKQTKKHNGIGVSTKKAIKNQGVKNQILPQFFVQGEKIKVLKTVEALLAKSPKKLLYKVHPCKAVAIEMCLLFLSLIIPKLLSHRYDNEEEEWKFLGGRFLRRVFNDKPDTYLNILAVLTCDRNSGMLEVGKGDNIGIKASKFRFAKLCSSKKIIRRVLKTDYAKKLSKKLIEESYNRVHDNPIVRNLVLLYPKITLPTIEEIIAEAKRIIKEGGKIKRGRELVF
ncbi:MAG: hypothetical protein IPP96_09405 [Chitinophagaceae bacterium]|nr:hypothetical protein [Chitinophagaceae bacterium]